MACNRDTFTFVVVVVIIIIIIIIIIVLVNFIYFLIYFFIIGGLFLNNECLKIRYSSFKYFIIIVLETSLLSKRMCLYPHILIHFRYQSLVVHRHHFRL